MKIKKFLIKVVLRYIILILSAKNIATQETKKINNDDFSLNFQTGTIQSDINDKNKIFSWIYAKSNNGSAGIFNNNNEYIFHLFYKLKIKENFIESGFLNDSLREGFIISNGGFDSGYSSLPNKKPAGAHFFGSYKNIYYDTAYYHAGFHFDKNENLLKENFNQSLFFYQIGLGTNKNSQPLLFYKLLAGALSDIEKNNFNNLLFYFELTNIVNKEKKTTFNFLFSAEYSSLFGGCIAFKISYINWSLKIKYFEYLNENNFTAGLYKKYKKGIFAKFNHEYIKSSIIISKDIIKHYHTIQYKSITAYFSFNNINLIGLLTNPPEEKVYPSVSLFKQVNGKGYMGSVSMGLGTLIRVGFVYADKFNDKYFQLNPMFLPSSFYQESMKEDNGFYFQNKIQGIEGYLNSKSFMFYFAALQNKTIFDNEESSIILFRISGKLIF
ncbi:MAG: hypothetical protein OEZ22_12455 [Spirochaetia bacterium]|nr:hypothetical protein [Spirochaetia bacterium]